MLWSKDLEVPRIDYRSAMEDDETLLECLVLLERYGIVLLSNASTRVEALTDIVEKIGFAKATHYG